MKRRLLEAGKTLLIVVLLCTAAALTILINIDIPFTGQNGGLAAALGSTPALQSEDTMTIASAAARPTTISVNNSMGRCTIHHDFEELDAAYETLGSFLGESFASAQGTAQVVTVASWQQALEQAGVLFRYRGSIPLSLLGAWLDADFPDDSAVSDILLSTNGETVRIYFAGASYAALDTGMETSHLTAMLEHYRPDGTAFAFAVEDAAYAKVDPFSLLGYEPQMPVVEAANPCDNQFVENTASRLGFNPYDDSRYTAYDGSTVFNESGCTLRVSTDGVLTLTSQNAKRFSAADASLQTVCAHGSGLLEQIGSDVWGEARLYLSGVQKDGAQTVLTYDYVIRGFPVYCPGGAATVTYTGSELTSLQLRLRTYTATAEWAALLPARLAAAIVPEGTLLEAEYADMGGNTLSAGWRS